MKTLPSALIIEKNRLSSPYPWIPLVHFAFPSPVGDVWLAGNLDDVTYSSQLYTAHDIQVKLPVSNVKPSVPECQIVAANQSRVFEQMVIDSGGGVDTLVTVTVVNTNNLSASYAALTWTFSVMQIKCNNAQVILNCSLYSPLDKKFPPDRYYGSTCRYKYFKGAECKYGGGEIGCDRTIDQCNTYGNGINFGGFPGITDGNVAFLFTKRI